MPAAVEAHSSGLVVLQKAAAQIAKKSQLTADNVEKLGQMLGPGKTLEGKMRAYQQAGLNTYYVDNSQGERERGRENVRDSESEGVREYTDTHGDGYVFALALAAARRKRQRHRQVRELSAPSTATSAVEEVRVQSPCMPHQGGVRRLQ